MKAYDSTGLTLDKDRLPALAGVARRHGESSRKTYLAGLWKEDMPSALTWVRLDSGTRPLNQDAPTWSWASLPRGRFFFHHSATTSVHFLGYNRSRPEADIYTAMGKTEIMVEGPVLDLRIYKQGRLQLRNDEPCPKLIGVLENAFFIINADFDMEPEDATKYQAVSDGTLCSLLLFFDANKPDWMGRYTFDFGMLLLQRPVINGEKAVFERIGQMDGRDLNLFSHLDKSGEFEDYCGGIRSWPFRKDESSSPVTLKWLLERVENRQITLVSSAGDRSC